MLASAPPASYLTKTEPGRNALFAQHVGPLGLVILLHFGLFLALQNGLTQHQKRPEPKEVVAMLITPQPAPTPPQPEPPKPAPPKPQPAPPKPAPPKPVPKPTKPVAKPVAPKPAEPAVTPPAPEPTPAPAVAAPPTPPVATAPAPTAPPGPVAPRTITSGVEYIQAPNPVYPPLSRRMSEEGTVMLRILVNEKGRPERVDIQKSSGFPRLDEAARQAALRAVFKPYMENGRPIPIYVPAPIKFQLDN